MKIKHKLILSSVVTIGLIALSLAFALHDISTIVGKIEFMEIAEDLSTSFLEMRLAEKNYFLFNDDTALRTIEMQTLEVEKTLSQVTPTVSSATGLDNISQLRALFADYVRAVDEAARTKSRDKATESALREAGHRLWEFSGKLARQERSDVNRIIASSTRGMIVSFAAILISAVLAGPLVYARILRSLHQVTRLARAISGGRFLRIKGTIPNDELGTVIQALNTMSDELRVRESELIQAKKLASLGTLTAGVAHEITNPLNNISMLAETFETLYDDLDEATRIDFMRRVRSEVERIRRVVQGLLNFSKPKAPNMRPIGLNEVVSGTMRLVQNMLDVSNIPVDMNLAPDLPPVLLDENQIQQVLVNIVTNAMQAMEPGGRLSITTRRSQDPGFEEMEFKDSGKGIPPDVLPHIFDPFFSTKGVGGTGLGLSVSYGIIKHHGGTITAANVAEGGAVFTIRLPVHQGGTTNEQTADHGD